MCPWPTKVIRDVVLIVTDVHACRRGAQTGGVGGGGDACAREACERARREVARGQLALHSKEIGTKSQLEADLAWQYHLSTRSWYLCSRKALPMPAMSFPT